MFYKTFYKTNPYVNYTVNSVYQNSPIPEAHAISEKTTVRITDNAFTTPKEYLVQSLTHWLNDATVWLEKNPNPYTSYNIPKASGGYRTITAPHDVLKNYQKQICGILIQLGATAHNCAYAYELHRTCKDALIKHQSHASKWFYKFDIKDFFPSCTEEVLMDTLSNVYPFCKLDTATLIKLIYVATHPLKYLPQGSPLSPLLSNMVLTSFDFIMYYSVRTFNGVYTRYADDILISTPTKHELNFIQHIVNKHLKETSSKFRLNTDKARCGAREGSNWNLGLMLNKDNKITIGHKKKLELKAKLNNFIFDFTNHKYWSIIDTQVLQGQINYFKTIEPEYATFVIKRLEQKYNHQYTLAQMFSAIITGRV